MAKECIATGHLIDVPNLDHLVDGTGDHDIPLELDRGDGADGERRPPLSALLEYALWNEVLGAPVLLIALSLEVALDPRAGPQVRRDRPTIALFIALLPH